MIPLTCIKTLQEASEELPISVVEYGYDVPAEENNEENCMFASGEADSQATSPTPLRPPRELRSALVSLVWRPHAPRGLQPESLTGSHRTTGQYWHGYLVEQMY